MDGFGSLGEVCLGRVTSVVVGQSRTREVLFGDVWLGSRGLVRIDGVRWVMAVMDG